MEGRRGCGEVAVERRAQKMSSAAAGSGSLAGAAADGPPTLASGIGASPAPSWASDVSALARFAGGAASAPSAGGSVEGGEVDEDGAGAAAAGGGGALTSSHTSGSPPTTSESSQPGFLQCRQGPHIENSR